VTATREPSAESVARNVVIFGGFALRFAFAGCGGGIMRLCVAMRVVANNKTAAHASTLASLQM
jgi:hypothetical protein